MFHLYAHLGIEGDLRHAGYLKSWLELLKPESKALFMAAVLAQKTADFLRGFSEEAHNDAE